MTRLFFAVFMVLVVCMQGAAAPTDHPTYAEARAMAEREAKAQGIDLSQYVLGPLDPHFDARKPAGKWDFFFHCKRAVPPGCFFEITVDRATGAIEYCPGV